tara:strand:+ start:1282 stop:1851 length:570 start_codon:yes stop_codon:yes gene_type:complete
MLTMESFLSDTSYDIELDKIKNKIKRLYEELLVKTYKSINPQATPEDIANFIENNELEFKETGFEAEADNLDDILDLLGKEDNLEQVKDKSYEIPNVETGKQLKSKSKEKTTAPLTTAMEMPKGGLFTPKDKHTMPLTKALKVPRGKISRIIDDNPKVNSQELKAIWEAEREKLVDLVNRRNKEFGVIL